METDILKYSLCYMTFTDNGDSSVYSSLVTQVPGWGHAIYVRVKCANYTVKSYRGALEKLVAEKPGYRGKGKLMLVAGRGVAIQKPPPPKVILLLSDDGRWRKS